MYDLYTKDLVDKIESISKDIDNSKQVLKIAESYFTSNLCDRVIILEDLRNKIPKIINVPVSNEERYFNLKLKQYYELSTIYDNQIEQKNRLISHKVKRKTYKYIVANFNNKLVNHMIFKKYKFNQFKLGGLCCHCNKNKNKPIDWVKSNINKEALLKEGKIPYTKEDAKIAEEKGLPYVAHEWLVYGNDYSFFFKWDITVHNFITMPNIKYFTFIPTKSSTSFIKVLSRFRNTMTEEEAINFYNTPANVN